MSVRCANALLVSSCEMSGASGWTPTSYDGLPMNARDDALAIEYDRPGIGVRPPFNVSLGVLLRGHVLRLTPYRAHLLGAHSYARHDRARRAGSLREIRACRVGTGVGGRRDGIGTIELAGKVLVDRQPVLARACVDLGMHRRRAGHDEQQQQKRPNEHRAANLSDQARGWLSSACENFRKPAIRCRAKLFAVAVLARRETRHAVKLHREVAMARTADALRDLGDRKIGLPKKRLRRLDAPLDDVAMRRYTRGCAKRMREMAGAQRHRLCERVERKLAMQVLVDEVDRAAKLVRRQLRLGPHHRGAPGRVFTQQVYGQFADMRVDVEATVPPFKLEPRQQLLANVLDIWVARREMGLDFEALGVDRAHVAGDRLQITGRQSQQYDQALPRLSPARRRTDRCDRDVARVHRAGARSAAARLMQLYATGEMHGNHMIEPLNDRVEVDETMQLEREPAPVAPSTAEERCREPALEHAGGRLRPHLSCGRAGGSRQTGCGEVCLVGHRALRTCAGRR